MITIRSHHEREIDHIATGMSPQPRWRTTPSSSWERETVMKMAPVLMKMALGALPHPGWVPVQRLLSPETEFRMAAEHRVVFANMTNRPRVYASGAIYRRRGGVGGCSRQPRHRRARATPGPRPAMAWWPRSPTPSPVWTSCSPRNIIDGAIRFVRFREYFLNRFSETKNSRKQGTGTVASC